MSSSQKVVDIVCRISTRYPFKNNDLNEFSFIYYILIEPYIFLLLLCITLQLRQHNRKHRQFYSLSHCETF